MSAASGDRKHKDTRSASRRAADPGPRSWGRGPTRRRPFRPLRWAWLLLLVALLAPAYDLFLPAGWQPARERRTVVIDRGESLHNIATELQRVGLIRSQVGFLVLARVMQLDRTVKAGQYSFRIGITVPALLRALAKGMFGLNLVTIPEGLMISETASLIQRQVGIRASAIDSLAHDAAMLDSLDVSAPSLEGWLAPDSYEWLPGTSAEVVLRTMVARTRDRVQRATAGYDSLPLGMNAHEVLTLASIVESESRAEVERPRIARVYLNRLDRGMLLQADPTVGYALGRGPRSRLTFKDLRVESAYNTYRHEGLPPGPICSPGPLGDRGGDARHAGHERPLLRRERPGPPHLRALVREAPREHRVREGHEGRRRGRREARDRRPGAAGHGRGAGACAAARGGHEDRAGVRRGVAHHRLALHDRGRRPRQHQGRGRDAHHGHGRSRGRHARGGQHAGPRPAQGGGH